jgi:uncharacterized membrane protein YeaQ/YmgE (transglycosylase-associated protein family)
MGILSFIILGAIIGWVASMALGRKNGLFMNIIIGIVGSLMGGFISSLLTSSNQSMLAFSGMGLVWSFIGAITLLGIAGVASDRNHHHA